MAKQGKGLTPRALERIVKGFANHRRIEIMQLLSREPELSVEDISEKLRIGYENASDHVRKLAIAGLVMKRNQGASVRHKLTDRGQDVLVFCKRLQ
jgi:DNA-binding transcriptional ArsR family regulator